MELATRRPGSPDLSDELLLARVAAADERALGALYDRHARSAYGLAVRVLRDHALAEDSVQEAFLAVWRSAPTYCSTRGSARSWILTLTHRRAVDIVRREQVRATAPLPEEERADAPIDLMAGIERQRVRAALRELPPQQREALELAYFGGFTQAEIAARLGQPLGTIKTRTFSALARLRSMLAEEELAPAPAEPLAAHG